MDELCQERRSQRRRPAGLAEKVDAAARPPCSWAIAPAPAIPHLATLRFFDEWMQRGRRLPNHGAGHEDLDCDSLPERHARREARSHRRRQVRCGRDLRERSCSPSTARRPTCAAPVAELGLEHRHPAAVPRLRGHAAGAARTRARARRTQVRRHAGAGLRSPDDLQQRRRPNALGGIDRAAADLQRAGRARRQARPAHRLRGAGLGPPHQRLPRRLGGGAARRPSRPSGWCSTASTSWRAAPISAPSAPIPGDRIFLVQLADAPLLCRWTTSRGAGISATFPARASCRCSTSWKRCQATGYDGALSLEIFNDQFRAGSARSVAVDGHRSLLLPARPAAPRGPAIGRRACRRCRRARSASGVEFIEFAVDDDERAAPSKQLLAGPRLPRAPAGTARRR